MDPFSIAIGALGITEFSVTSIVELREITHNLADAKDTIEDIATNLDGIQRPLAALQNLSITDETKDDFEKVGLSDAVNNCGAACADFSKKLQQWTKHSNSAKLSLRDRLSIGVWNKEKIRTIRTQVQSCRDVVQFAVKSGQLIVQLRSNSVSLAARQELKTKLQNIENIIQVHIDATNKQLVDASKRIEPLRNEDKDDEDDEAQRALALKEVEKQISILEANQVSTAVLFAQCRTQSTNQDISNVITSDNSSAIVGLPESLIGKVDKRIRNIRTEGKSGAVVGIFSGNMNIQRFWSEEREE